MTYSIHSMLVLVGAQLEKNMNSCLRSSFDKYSLDVERSWSQKKKDAFFQALLYVMLF